MSDTLSRWRTEVDEMQHVLDQYHGVAARFWSGWRCGGPTVSKYGCFSCDMVVSLFFEVPR